MTYDHDETPDPYEPDEIVFDTNGEPEEQCSQAKRPRRSQLRFLGVLSKSTEVLYENGCFTIIYSDSRYEACVIDLAEVEKLAEFADGLKRDGIIKEGDSE